MQNDYPEQPEDNDKYPISIQKMYFETEGSAI